MPLLAAGTTVHASLYLLQNSMGKAPIFLGCAKFQLIPANEKNNKTKKPIELVIRKKKAARWRCSPGTVLYCLTLANKQAVHTLQQSSMPMIRRAQVNPAKDMHNLRANLSLPLVPFLKQKAVT